MKKTLDELFQGFEARLREAIRKDNEARRLATSTAQTKMEKRPMPVMAKVPREKLPEKNH